MAAKGSCVKTKTRYDEIGMTAYTWTATADASGDAHDNASADAEWFHYGVSGILMSVLVTYDDCDANYDFYIYDSQLFDLLKAKGTNLQNSAAHANNRFCSMLTTDLTNVGMPVVLVDETLEFLGDEMGNATSGAITLFVRDFTDPKFR